MKKISGIFICLIVLLLCGCGQSEKVQAVTDDFNSSTNEMLRFRNLEIEVPNKWEYGTKNNEEVFFTNPSSKIGLCSIKLLTYEPVSKETLKTEEFQKTIIANYKEELGYRFEEINIQNEKIEILNSDGNKANEVCYSFEFAGKLDIINYEEDELTEIPEEGDQGLIRVNVFLLDNQLYGMQIPWTSIDESDFSKDADKIYNSITGGMETLFTMDIEPIEATYDSIIAGEHTNEIISIEAIVSSYEYDDFFKEYHFDLWYWSDKEKKYIQDGLYWGFGSDKYKPEQLEQIKKLHDGDKIRLITEVNSDNSFSLFGYIWLDIISHGKLSDYKIIVPPEEDYTNQEMNEEKTAEEVTRYVYITNSGTKYHDSTCRMLKDSKKKIAYDDAKARGYSACGICNPMP